VAYNDDTALDASIQHNGIVATERQDIPSLPLMHRRRNARFVVLYGLMRRYRVQLHEMIVKCAETVEEQREKGGLEGVLSGRVGPATTTTYLEIMDEEAFEECRRRIRQFAKEQVEVLEEIIAFERHVFSGMAEKRRGR
jgi:hypothetical protein